MTNPRRAAIITLGCKVNWCDSQAMAGALRAAGFEVMDSGETAEADVYIVNTCAVTAEAERQSRQTVRRLTRLHPGAAVVAAGCASQKDPEGFAADGAAAVCGTAGRSGIAATAQRALLHEAGNEQVLFSDIRFEELTAEAQTGHTRAFMKIEDGCDARCAYCIVPDLRGEPRSRTLDGILREAAALVARGFKEIVITGINLSCFGADLPGHPTLADAAEAVAASGVARVRLGSLEPEAITGELLARLKTLKSFCPHFHVSLQSGSAGTLRRMGRRYSPQRYMEKLGAIREVFPLAGVTTDVIVGFPGETGEEFAESAAFVESARFLKVHVFPYSVRPGTPAAEMPDQVPKDMKRARALAMQAAAGVGFREYAETLIGQTVSVLFEQPCKSLPGFLRGYAENYAEVAAKAEKGEKGEIRQVLLSGLNGEDFTGIMQK